MLPIVIVNYNSTNDTIKCLDSIYKSNFQDFHIIIVDNQSKKDEYIKLKHYVSHSSISSKITLLLSHKNGGFAFGNNLGIKYAQSNFNNWDFIWLLNNDTVIKPESITQINNQIKLLAPNCGIFGHLLLYLDNPQLIQAAGGKYNKILGQGININSRKPNAVPYNTPNSIDYIIGASMIIKKDFINDVGLMSEDYFLFFEELDWIERGKKNGWIFQYFPNISILHAHGGSTTKKDSSTSLFAEKCSFRSRILFTKRFHPIYLPTVFITCLLSIAIRLFKGKISNSIKLFQTIIHTSFYEK